MSQKDLTKTFDSLERNPIFQFSLASNELFHSNFLYWLVQVCPEKVTEIFSSYLGDKIQKSLSGRKLEATREERNFDLVLKWLDSEGGDNPIYLVIENKVKSLPYQRQLRSYKNNVWKEASLLLLTLGNTRLEEKGGDSNIVEGWRILHFKDLKKDLEEVKKEDFTKLVTEEKRTYALQTLKGYIELIEGLIEVSEDAIVESPKEKFDFLDTCKNKNLEAYRRLRIHDLYLKRKYESLLQEAQKYLEKEGFTILQDDEFVFVDAKENLKPGVCLTSGFTHGEGLMDIKHTIGKTAAVGIQLQGNRFGLVLEKKGGAKPGADRLYDKGKWFDFSILDKQIGKVNGYNGKKWSTDGQPKNDDRFNSYKDNFFYRYKKIPQEARIETVINACVGYMKQASRWHDEIKESVFHKQ